VLLQLPDDDDLAPEIASVAVMVWVVEPGS
jgi:hypothetical protein